MKDKKCVIILDGALPAGVCINAAAVLSASLGAKNPRIVGPDVLDRSGGLQAGIIKIPVPVLKTDRERLSFLKEKLSRSEFAGVECVGFSTLAQRCRTYQEYQTKMASVSAQELQWLALLLIGDKTDVTRLTGNLPLYR